MLRIVSGAHNHVIVSVIILKEFFFELVSYLERLSANK